ncbi:hypothetical protein KFL_002420070 [Klebsormidium nitens]|uniref:Uncharacterized protein n=1 Tax=Klebsormidium nitens TaxID=105231 RepID=A0A1Y1I501_KLENI|nr:hypothetical protein KFL_002420070 [Klebsormidium nitens]|eukprot:GAQ85573.1 hypothetical protein KFL_002420070 [Klebsormidium nitens]
MDPAGLGRLWRPAAQRRVRTAFSSIASARADWAKASSRGLAAATALVNAHITKGFIGGMDIGILADLKGIKDSAKMKLRQRQEKHLANVVEAYEELVRTLSQMEEAASSMRTYLVAPNGSPIVRVANAEESKLAEAAGDNGLGQGVPVYACLSLKTLESLAMEMVEFYKQELHVKFLLTSEFQALVHGTPESSSDEDSAGVARASGRAVSETTLQVYLTAWLGEALLDKSRLDEIVGIMSEEMQAA